MTRRIAEFESEYDAMDFMRMKGEQFYTVCGGINMPWAVRQYRRESINHSPFEPPDVVPVRERDPDVAMLEDYE